jgi:type IV pilus assembly protein PilM
MASGAVWGIDIGQCALKALRCRPHEDPKKVVAEAFDYIEYPKILSQPGSDPTELIGDALKQFLSRNTVLGDRVAVSVGGQAGLARFIKLPPLEAKKIPDLVRYEARQQIPFDLNDVVWDYQRMGGGSVEEGFALDTEIGLFAMKRDAVFRALDPFLKFDIEVDVVQLTPLVLYNYLVFDQMPDLPPPEDFDPENPPESVVIISMGTDATDLVITNGFRVWQRSIPIGGSHFTKALTRELKLTFAKAEHLKRNATAASDPKAVFQAMKPTFSDLLTELQRSIGYFSNLDRAAKIGRVVALGNAMKLPGLRRYLSQSLGYDIEKIDSFRSMEGSQVVASPAFQENLLSFGVCYGLTLQGLGKGAVHTNLLPKEITQSRLIKRKKPWAVAAAALVLLGCAVSYAAHSLALGGVDANTWKSAQDQAKSLKTTADNFSTADTTARGKFVESDQTGKHLVGNAEGRIRWLDLLAAINACLPTGEDPKPNIASKDKETALAEDIMRRRELHVTNLDTQQVDDPAGWIASVKAKEEKPAGSDAAAASADNSSAAPGASGTKRPTWLVQISGYHFHNSRNADRDNQGAQYVRNTLLKALAQNEVKLPAVDGNGGEVVSMADLGISCPVIVNIGNIDDWPISDPNAESASAAGAGPGMMGGPGGDGAAAPKMIPLRRYEFVVQFCWRPTTPLERREIKKAREAQEKAKVAAQAAQAANKTAQP